MSKLAVDDNKITELAYLQMANERAERDAHELAGLQHYVTIYRAALIEIAATDDYYSQWAAEIAKEALSPTQGPE